MNCPHCGEEITAPFNPGDRVKALGPTSKEADYRGKTGTVRSIEEPRLTVLVELDFEKGRGIVTEFNVPDLEAIRPHSRGMD